MEWLGTSSFWISTLYICGLGLPAWGLIAAYTKTSKQHQDNLGERNFRRELNSWHSVESERIMQIGLSGEVVAELQKLQAEYGRRMVAAGYSVMTFGDFDAGVGLGNLTDLANAVRAAKSELCLIGIGLVLATAASIWSTLR